MALVQLLGTEAEEHIGQLKAAGHEVRSGRPGAGLLKEMTGKLPDVVVIDLSRAPSTGRDIALAIRKRKALRHVPFVFVEGPAEKVRNVLPGETYGSWSNAPALIARALAAGASGAAPSVMAGYADTPLAKKMGIEAGMAVAVMGEPKGFRERMPEGVRWRERPGKACAAAIWFARSGAEIEAEMDWVARSGVKRLWIAWAKGVSKDGMQGRIRASARAAGLAEWKICSIDATWAAICFSPPRG